MNKSLLMSLSPYWYYLIGEGKKTIEVRKTIPQDPDWNRQVECYMTKDKKSFARIPKELQEKYHAHMGKAGMRFRCDRKEDFKITDGGVQFKRFSALHETALSVREIHEYANGKSILYGLHISDLKIYDKPKELWEFKRNCGQYGADHPLCDDCKYFIDGRSYEYDESDCAVCGYIPLTRPPQSWMYIEEMIE